MNYTFDFEVQCLAHHQNREVGGDACGGNWELDMVRSWELPDVSDDDILAAEQSIAQAFETRTVDHLNVFGLGEISLAVGWPTQRPSAVLKRQAPGRPDHVRAEVERARRYHTALAASGISVLPTEIRTVTTAAGDDVMYLVQPVVAQEHLAEHILAAEGAPSAAHPILISLRDAAKRIVREDVGGGLSLDCQVTNFAWDGEQVVSLDTTPAMSSLSPTVSPARCTKRRTGAYSASANTSMRSSRRPSPKARARIMKSRLGDVG